MPKKAAVCSNDPCGGSCLCRRRHGPPNLYESSREAGERRCSLGLAPALLSAGREPCRRCARSLRSRTVCGDWQGVLRNGPCGGRDEALPLSRESDRRRDFGNRGLRSCGRPISRLLCRLSMTVTHFRRSAQITPTRVAPSQIEARDNRRPGCRGRPRCVRLWRVKRS
jgi:hypothetical protein